MKTEYMLLQLLDTLKKYKNISLRRAAIFKVEETKQDSPLSYISIPQVKVLTDIRFCQESLNAQRKLLYDEINKKKFHEKLHRARSNELVSLKGFSTWMKYGNIDPRAEGIYCYIQDRNIFWRDDALQCQHCGKAKKSKDYLATGCYRMLGYNYTRRHNEVLKCI
ncbi:hypothetical protein TCON_2056 [Astathelohania contejeani]|uniref:Uncharacterized protein n=1 Tax=Astathelohania contejeani TaxID=164912 RepID=A0ABQ7HX17_9MICR|nr:hypothetical protein TCON_2056 [Thelohania contejeani]